MSEPTGKEKPHGDLRWLVLVLAALVIAFSAQLGRIPVHIDKLLGGGAKKPVRIWTESDWRWREDGPLGEGVYRESRRSAGTDLIDVRPAEIDPRLAIFTYRPIDLNRADVEVLQTVRGIGPKLAGAIIAYRRNHGPFRSLDELLQVKGIGPAKLANLNGRFTVKELRED